MPERFVVLHGLLVKKSGTAADVAALLGLAEPEVAALLDAAQADGEVLGARGLYMLGPVGRATLEAAYPQRCRGLREDALFVGAYERFETVNRQLLGLFTRWQTVTTGGASHPNDHGDADYDAAIVDELGDLHERAEPILAALAAAEPRMAVYGERLGSAYDRVLAGGREFVSGVQVDSYHTVWFELHEDLLRLLGREREE